MPKSLSIKLDKSQLLGLLVLLGIAVIFISIAMAITAFTPQNQPTGYVAQDEMSNYNLTSGSETLYRPEYERENWSGNLYAYPANASGGLDFANERWTGTGGKGAKWHIDAQNYSTGRFIATMKDTGAAIPFLSASMSAAQQASLAAIIQGTAYTSDNIVNFLRGDRSNEGSTALRQRSSVLGDIIHSRPYYVDDATYFDGTTNPSPNPTIFVGANDGMLHAINATNTASGGSERWAYVPSMLLPKMDTLAANPYTHDYFVDGQINIADIVISGSPTKVLVGGLGSGGRGLYGLNITTLTATSNATAASKILWEITPTKISYAPTPSATASSAYSNLGYTYGTPTIGQTQDNSYSVIAGNGYNDAGDYQAYLYVINAANGQLIKAIKAGTSGTAASPNGLSTPAAIDDNNDGKIDYVYAGDLNGNMWKFDISNASSGSWPNTATLLYAAGQPITSTPGVAAHPNGGYMVTFGTGQMLSYTFPSAVRTNITDPAPTGTDPDRATVYYAYGIWDGAPVTNSTLITQTLTERSYTDNLGVARRVRRSTANAPSWASGGNKGWKVALPAGERVVGEGSFIESGRYYFNSYNPNISLAVPNTTTNVFGENWLNELNYLTGGSSALPFLDLNADLLLNDSDRIKYIASDTLPTGKAVGDPILSPNQDGIPVSKWLSNGVQSQPILVTLKTLNTTLFNQNPDVSFPTIATGVRGVAGGHFDVDFFYGTNMNCNNVAGQGSQAIGSVTFTYSSSKNPTNITITVGGVTLVNFNPNNDSSSALATEVRNNNLSSDYTITKSGSTVTITANNVGTAYNGNIVVTYTGATGLTYSTVNASGGVDTVSPYSDSSTSCNNVVHKHEYDDLYDRTGVNFLNASLPSLDLSNAVSSNTTNFKVLMMNQYLNPSLSLHIGNASYNETSGAGYISVKSYQTAANLDITTVPAYNRSTIGSLAINMPIDAFEIKNWWGNGDTRVGLQPTQPGCVINGPVDASGNTGTGASADLYNPVIPPANGINGAGTLGTTAGVRHNGALNLEIIKSNTPQSAIEENVAGRPEYGFRVKQAYYYTYVLAEYAVYWHHPNRVCYHDSTTTWYKAPTAGSHTGESGGNGYSTAAYGAWNTAALMVGTGWTKTPPQDITGLAPGAALDASAGTDPHLGTFGATGALASTTVSVSGNVTTTTYNYIDGTKIIILRTINNDGTVTIQTTNYQNDGVTVASTSTSIVADNSGSVKTGGDERGLQARTGRVSWHELVRN